MYTPEELKVLDRIAEQQIGWKFEELDFEDQDMIYCFAEDNGLL